MMSPAAKSACLSIGLVSAWAPIADADVMTRVRVTESMPDYVTHSMLMLAGPGSGDAGVMLSNLTWNGGTPDFIVDRSPTEITSYAMVGLTGMGSGFMHLVVSSPGLTYIGGMAFEQAFPGWNEQQVIDQLWAGGPDAGAFLRTNFAVLLTGSSAPAHVAKFSNGSPFGSMSIQVTAVPAPGVMAMMPLAVLAFRRRR